MARGRVRLRAYGWSHRHRGGQRKTAAAGGDIWNGFIVGVKSLWAMPHNRKGRRRTVRRRR